jgi:hypothetical protein
MNSLTAIFNKYDSDKNSYFHNYCRQYETLLNDYRDKEITILEIGVFKGESLKVWRDVFPNAKCIIGVDIDNNTRQYERTDVGIFVEIGDATNEDFILYLQQKYGAFDIIIDDGSHTNRDVIISFEQFFPLISDEGLYIVEDTISYKSSHHIDPNYPNHLIYFYKYIPYLNQWRFDSTKGNIKDNCVDPFKISKKAENIFEASIDLITFGISFIAIHKKIRHHWL